MSKAEMRVTFPGGNNLPYGQDFSFHRGIPDGIEFVVETTIGDFYVLRAPGYGDPGNYGNGALYVSKSRLNIEDFEVKPGKETLQSRIAELEAKNNRLVELAEGLADMVDWSGCDCDKPYVLTEWEEFIAGVQE